MGFFLETFSYFWKKVIFLLTVFYKNFRIQNATGLGAVQNYGQGNRLQELYFPSTEENHAQQDLYSCVALFAKVYSLFGGYSFQLSEWKRKSEAGELFER